MITGRTTPGRSRGRIFVAALLCCAAACSSPEPRSYEFFRADKIARDGALARCELDPAAARTDIECANARRAALAVQLDEERRRREALERESAARIEALRREYEAERQAREAAEAAAAAQAALGVYPDEFFETVTVPADAPATADVEDPGTDPQAAE